MLVCSQWVYTVVCIYRKQQSVDETVQQMHAKGYTVGGCACHVGSAEQRQNFIEQAVKVPVSVDAL
jgi:dehydrogenase/reductase SDR family protein 4